jgi:4-hydroxyacetophenone monooxygenase
VDIIETMRFNIHASVAPCGCCRIVQSVEEPVTEPSSSNPPAGDIDPERLWSALEVANLPTLLLVLTQLTGDGRWLDTPYRPRRGPVLDDNDSGSLPEDVQQEIRAAAYDAILHRDPAANLPVPSPERVAEMVSVALVEDVPAEYGPLLAEELGALSRDVDVPAVQDGFRVLVIGAGMSGIALGIKLKRAGVPFTIVEKDSDIGGTWLENTYPGCGVDTPSHLYSFAFEPNTRWTRFFAKRPEVHEYFARLVDEHGLREHIQFSTEVVRAHYEVDSATWAVETTCPEGSRLWTVPVLVSAVGQVNRPSIPPIEGSESFQGPTMHTARWRHDVDYAGKRVAVIGNGASAMQLVPAIAGVAEHVTVFQRSKQWVVPHPNYHRTVPEGVRYLMDVVPEYAGWYRLRSFWNFSDRLHPSLQIDPTWPHPERSINATNERHRIFLTNYIKDELGDREDLLDACVPDYPPYGKRPLLDNGWFKVIQRDDVTLVTEAVARIGEDSVQTASGASYEADIVVWATGFKALQFLWPMEIRGASGRTLAEQWGKDDARAYLGVTVPDFPNFFILNGPNTFAGHGGSAIIATEFQVRQVMQAVALLAAGEVDSLEVREDVFWKYNDELDAALSRSIWSHPGMTNWFRNSAGRLVVSSPWTYLDYWNRTLRLETTDYHVSSSGVVA